MLCVLLIILDPALKTANHQTNTNINTDIDAQANNGLINNGNERTETVKKSPNVLNQLKNLGREGELKQAEVNPYLDSFLSKHVKPEITMSGETDFFLRMDRRYSFRPGIRLAPFRSFSEPWPMPQEYQSNPENVFQLNPASFQIMILNRTSDILQDAVRRYTAIIQKHSLEEPYSLLNNFNENFEKYNRDDPKKYETIQPLPHLSVYVSGSDTGYPQLDNNESCKYMFRFLNPVIVTSKVA